MVTQAQIDANRQNAQASTGPSSPEGLATSSQNAVKYGLNGRVDVLPWENPNDYNRFAQCMIEAYAPQDHRELTLVKRMISLEWRIDRIPTVEVDLFQKYQDDPSRLIHELNKLSTSETRLYRNLERTRKDLNRYCEQKEYARAYGLEMPTASSAFDPKEEVVAEALTPPMPHPPPEDIGSGPPVTDEVSENTPADEAEMPLAKGVPPEMVQQADQTGVSAELGSFYNFSETTPDGSYDVSLKNGSPHQNGHFVDTLPPEKG